MHVFFSGIGGTAIGPLALIAKQAGYTVSGSDKQNSQYIEYLRKQGIDSIHIGQSTEQIAEVHNSQPIDWFVYTSALPLENPNAPELAFCKEKGIKTSKRDELLNQILDDKNLKLVAIAGTHGKTTTTAMAVWLFKQLGVPASYSVGAKIPFGDMGHFDPKAEYFIYECDEFDHNFLAFSPYISLITGVDYDHHEVFPTRENYQEAFKQFISQSKRAVIWQSDIKKNGFTARPKDIVLDDHDTILNALSIAGEVNRRNAWQVVSSASTLLNKPSQELTPAIENFPGLSRRFEKISDNLYTDYAHTPPKIAGCLQLARELSDNVVVVYEPLTNRRQHYIKNEYKSLFNGAKKLYWTPSYLAREDPNQPVLSPTELIKQMDNKEIAEAAELDEWLKEKIRSHIKADDMVVCMSGGGGGSLDEWLRANFSN